MRVAGGRSASRRLRRWRVPQFSIGGLPAEGAVGWFPGQIRFRLDAVEQHGFIGVGRVAGHLAQGCAGHLGEF